MTQYKNENYKQLTTPKTAFCTFNSDKDFHAILNYAAQRNNQILYRERPLEFKRAKDPNNIIWEND